MWNRFWRKRAGCKTVERPAKPKRKDRLKTTRSRANGQAWGAEADGKASRFAAQGLNREILIFHRNVVLQLFEFQNGAAAALQIFHLDGVRRPETLDVADIRVFRPADQLRLF